MNASAIIFAQIAMLQYSLVHKTEYMVI